MIVKGRNVLTNEVVVVEVREIVLSPPLTYRNMTLDTESGLFAVDGQRVHLTPTQYRIMEVLLAKSNHSARWDELSELVLGCEYDGAAQGTLKVHVCQLRKKVSHIKTIRGHGIRLD